MTFLEILTDFFKNDLSGIVGYLRIIGLFISLGFLGGAIYAWFGIMNLKLQLKEKHEEHFNIAKAQQSPRLKRWDTIAVMFKSPNPTNWRMAVIDADSMLEDLVTEMGHQGDSFGEKLQSIRRDGVSWTDAAWEVHLLRNKLAHEGSRYPLTDREAFRAYKIYENILITSGYLA
ncbi:MAG: hypothetical protein ACJAV6_000119 [Candidatus Paceibacteria bacterium]|jgi:hypothetical protein